MRRLALAVVATAFVGSSAFAADMPVKAPLLSPVSAYNWTGLYIGIHIGGGWAYKSFTETGINLGSHTASGILGGGQIGYNWQTGAWVFGVEAQFSGADLTGGHIDQFGSDIRTRVDFLGTVAGRVGYAWDRHLVYVKGGFAWAHDKYEDFDTTSPGVPFFGGASETRTGWMLGVGWEYAFMPNWSAKIEYNYLDLGTKSITWSGGTGGIFARDIKQDISLVKVGLNYRLFAR